MTTPEAERLAYSFDEPPPGEPDDWTAALGGKGAGLARMQALGLPVPPGFTLPTSVCHRVLDDGWFDELDAAIAEGVARLETELGRTLGSLARPLLVSVRSGAPVSMPGMMDTVLNLGMTPDVAASLGALAGDDRFGWDTYRRFIEGYVEVVGGAPDDEIERCFTAASGGRAFSEIATGELAQVLDRWRYELEGCEFVIPTGPMAQITQAVRAVFASWRSDRAVVYRRKEGIDGELGTAATVQAMVFGNLSDQSGTGVAFTRDPSSGEAVLMGDFLVRAQGEDVVAGTHLTQPIAGVAARWPEIHDQLVEIAAVLERDLADMVDIEFTVEDRILWMLQARVGKRSPRAAVRMAVEMAEDPDFPLDRAGAVERVAHLLDDPPMESAAADDHDAVVLAEGLAASPGRAIGVVCLDPDLAVTWAEEGRSVILIRPETSPADVHGMAAARGLVTTLGGLVSHAAVVARSWGLPAVVGAGPLRFVADGVETGDLTLRPGDEVTVDGDHGRLLLGAHAGGGGQVAEVAVLRRWAAEAGGSSAPGSVFGAAPPAPEPAPGGGGGRALSADDCRRVLVLKGMATAVTVAEWAGVSENEAMAALAELAAAGHTQDGPSGRVMLSADGTAAADAFYLAEAAAATPVIEPHLDRFHQLNHRFKEVVTAWQLREIAGERVLNDHSDPDYDAGVLAALTDEIHVGICEILAAVVEGVARLDAYRPRLEAAVAAIRAGELEMVANPLRNSYHTVWFELHEELIRLSGRNRGDETAAGRA
ncbi:MAG: PEP/pyruvate-binding domain-containing protein [Acidimicrobiales bacterium]